VREVVSIGKKKQPEKWLREVIVESAPGRTGKKKRGYSGKKPVTK